MISIDLSKAHLTQDLSKYENEAKKSLGFLKDQNYKGNDFLGWVNWPIEYDKEELERIHQIKKTLEGTYNVVLVCGIGGSYLGTRAASEMIRGLYPNDGIEIIYVGNTFSHTYISQILAYLKDKEPVLNVISKSGTTTETSVAFRIFKKFMEEKYGNKAKDRILVTTDKKKGTLKKLADIEDYQTFTIPDNIGGRYSVFTAVGLLPLALANINVDEIIKGSLEARNDLLNDDLDKNPAMKYAVARRILNSQGYKAEMFVSYHPQLAQVAEWWKQLFGESEGKEGNGILPTSAIFSTDLHSLGQFIQDGNKCLFETVLDIDTMPNDIIFPNDENNLDEMNYLADKKVSWINESAKSGTLSAHTNEGGVPNIVIKLKDNSAYSFGYMIYFFFISCGITCYMLDINPFNQPGVEVYKKKMFELLGKK